MKKSILVVDDEPSLQHAARQTLEKEGFAVRVAGSFDEALSQLEVALPDLALLDVRMPGKSGFDLCKKIRETPAWKPLPIIFLTSRDDESGKVLGLELGGDDYVVKPYSGAELVARVKAVMRRRTPEEEGEEILTDGDLTVFVSRREIRHGNKPVRVRAKEFDLLCCLLRKKGRVLTRPHLLERVWKKDEDGPLSRTVDTHVYRLRKSMGAALAARVQAVGAVGYKWVEAE